MSQNRIMVVLKSLTVHCKLILGEKRFTSNSLIYIYCIFIFLVLLMQISNMKKASKHAVSVSFNAYLSYLV
jgi:hypothetical protein